MSPWHTQVSSNINSFNNIVNFVTELDDEGHQILQWLSPLEPQQRHRGVRSSRLSGVGNWVLETNEFRKWRDVEDGCVEPVLFCYGNPGVGKTYVSSLVIDSLCDQAVGEEVAVVGLYCDFHAQQEQSTANMLGAILKQLVRRGGIPEYIREAFQKAKREVGGRGLRVPDMVETLKKAITSLPRVFICVDALDECAAKHRRELLESLREIVRVSPNVRVFFTARPNIDDEIVRCFVEVVRIPLSPTHEDIQSYLAARLESDTEPYAMTDELRADIMRIIPEKVSEIFLLVSLNIDAILGEITISYRRKKLNKIAEGEGLGLGDAYAATLSRIKAQPRIRAKLGIEVLMWVAHAERPLQVDELCHALGVEEESIDLDTRNIPAIETLLSCSLGLVTVKKPSSTSASTVQLVHYTLQEYLFYSPDLFLMPHSMIAKVCLTYLNFLHVRGFSSALPSVPLTAPFVEYASCYWSTHARREITESVKTLALKLLDEYDKHISSKILLLRGVGLWNPPFDREGTPRGFTGLHRAAYLGCVEITAALLESSKWDVQATDFNGNTALAWAARKGHEGVVSVLLERRDLNPDQADKWSQTPLSWAAENGHEGVVRRLLGREDVDPNTADEHGRTPLSGAAMNGHEGVVRMLLEQGNVNPDKADKSNRTPLSRAAQRGFEGVVGMLLERRDVNPSTVDAEDGRTPLSFAAENGHVGVVRMLLDRGDVDPNTADSEDGRTPLSFGAANGHEGVVIALLELDGVNPHIADKWNLTPLSWAGTNGHEGIIKLLSQWGPRV